MSNTTVYSREFLRGYQEQYRRQIADNHISKWIGDILTAARHGALEWSYDIGKWRDELERSSVRTSPPTPVPTNEDIVEGLLHKFPDCNVIISQDWFETRKGTRELQTRVIVSWK